MTPVDLVRAPGEGPPTLPELFANIAEWSDRTFGLPATRGPIGPWKHAVTEILVELLGYDRAVVKGWLATEPSHPGNPAEPVKQADVLILWCDAVRRSGNALSDILTAAIAKMSLNRMRYYPPPVGDEVAEHDRSRD